MKKLRNTRKGSLYWKSPRLSRKTGSSSFAVVIPGDIHMMIQFIHLPVGCCEYVLSFQFSVFFLLLLELLFLVILKYKLLETGRGKAIDYGKYEL